MNFVRNWGRRENLYSLYYRLIEISRNWEGEGNMESELLLGI